MTIEQIIDIPADYRISLELPRSIPAGVKARIEINIPAPVANDQNNSTFRPSAKIEDIRQLLQKEMTKKGTSAIMAAAGDGWEAHVKEHYAES